MSITPICRKLIAQIPLVASRDVCASRNDNKKIIKHNIVLHASTTASSSSAMLEQARRSTHDTARHVTTRTCRACRVVT